VGPRTVLDEVVKGKIPSPRRESNPRTPIFQPVAQRYRQYFNTVLCKERTKLRSLGSSVSIMTGYGLDERGSIPDRGNEIFSLLHGVQTGSETIQAPVQWVLEVEQPRRETDHSPPSSAENKNAWSYSSTPPYVFMI
jgi:hypothetical protein